MVRKTREVYHLMNPHRLPDGQVAVQWEGGIKLPRICFVADYQNRKGDWRMLSYNGLVVAGSTGGERLTDIRESGGS